MLPVTAHRTTGQRKKSLTSLPWESPADPTFLDYLLCYKFSLDLQCVIILFFSFPYQTSLSEVKRKKFLPKGYFKFSRLCYLDPLDILFVCFLTAVVMITCSLSPSLPHLSELVQPVPTWQPAWHQPLNFHAWMGSDPNSSVFLGGNFAPSCSLSGPNGRRVLRGSLCFPSV